MANNCDPAELNPGFYNLQPYDVAFFKQQTGIHYDELLKQHIMQVQAKAYKVYLPSLLTDIHCSFHPIFCRFITISVSFAPTSLISRLLPCPVISRRSASSKNATGLSCSTLVVAVSSFSQQLFFSYLFIRWLAYPKTSSLPAFTKVNRYLSISRSVLYIRQISGNMTTNYSNLHLRLTRVTPSPWSQESFLIPLLFLSFLIHGRRERNYNRFLKHPILAYPFKAKYPPYTCHPFSIFSLRAVSYNWRNCVFPSLTWEYLVSMSECLSTRWWRNVQWAQYVLSFT